MSRQRDIYKRAHGISFLKNEKTTFKLAARSSKHLLLLNPYIGFKLLSSLRNFNFFPKLPYADKYNDRCMSPRG